MVSINPQEYLLNDELFTPKNMTFPVNTANRKCRDNSLIEPLISFSVHPNEG